MTGYVKKKKKVASNKKKRATKSYYGGRGKKMKSTSTYGRKVNQTRRWYWLQSTSIIGGT